MERLIRFRWAALGLLCLGLVAMMPGLQRAVTPDHSLSIWFLDDDPGYQSYQTFLDTFGNDEVLAIWVEEPDGVFEPEALERLSELAGALETVEGVENTYSVTEVESIDEERLFREEVLSDPELLEESAVRVMRHPMVSEQLVAADERSAMVVVQMEASPDFDDRRASILDDVLEQTEAVLGPNGYRAGGVGIIYQALNDLTERDFGLFIALAYLLMFALMWWVFRSLRLVFASLGVVAGGTIFALGALGWAGLQVNMITVLLPTLIVVLGIADALHFPVAYRRVAAKYPDESREDILARALKAAAIPCLMTTLTTMAGFLALASSSLPGVRHLGLFAALGIGSAFVTALVLMPIALFGRDQSQVRELAGLARFLDAIHRMVSTRGLLLAALLVVSSVVAAVGVSKVEVDTYTLGFLPDDHPVVVDNEKIQQNWGPYIPLEFLVSHPEGGLEDPAALARLRTFAEAAAENPHVGDPMYVEEVYRALASPDAPDEDLDAKQIAEAHADLASIEQGNELLSRLIGPDGRLARVTFPVEMMSASELGETIEQIEADAAKVYGDDTEVLPSGYLPLYASVVDHIVDSQIKSFGLAVLLIFVLMLFWMRSVRLAVVSLLPNLFPVLIMLGVMGWSQTIRLDAVTSVVAALVLGIAIDDTVHFLHAWKDAEADGLGWEECLRRVLGEVGPAICITSLLLVAGFSILMAAELGTVVYFGLLTVVATLATFVGDLIMLPLLLKLWPPSRPEETP
ncbi:MAG: efflux RND transporter permease subunit [Persicimonas sp.]